MFRLTGPLILIISMATPAAESVMSTKSHGTSEAPVQSTLRWGSDTETADRICCLNRHYAEHSGYFMTAARASFAKELMASPDDEPMNFYDSVTGKLLFVAPRGRTKAAFLAESKAHGWPSFRDAEVASPDVCVLPNGETVSRAGTHLGHNLPDGKGNRYCINLVCVAGAAEDES